jgi:uncharacterized short protein YbdD (DUF466 family)
MSRWLAELARVVRRVIGVPDYDAYLAHMQAHHPGIAPLDAGSFARDALSRRYDRPGSRCC